MERRKVYPRHSDEIRTKRHMAPGTELTAILDRVRHGEAPVGNPGQPKYGDFSGSMDYHEAMTRLCDAKSAFQELPSHVRDHCRNDPGLFLDMVHDPARRQELEALGLIEAQMPEGLQASPRAPDGSIIPHTSKEEPAPLAKPAGKD